MRCVQLRVWHVSNLSRLSKQLHFFSTGNYTLTTACLSTRRVAFVTDRHDCVEWSWSNDCAGLWLTALHLFYVLWNIAYCYQIRHWNRVQKYWSLIIDCSFELPWNEFAASLPLWHKAVTPALSLLSYFKIHCVNKFFAFLKMVTWTFVFDWIISGSHTAKYASDDAATISSYADCCCSCSCRSHGTNQGSGGSKSGDKCLSQKDCFCW